ASRRCETQAPLGGQAAKLCYRFGPLTPSARSANLIAGDGTKNGLSRSEQRTATNQKPPLDTKSPIQVRIQLSVLFGASKNARDSAILGERTKGVLSRVLSQR